LPEEDINGFMIQGIPISFTAFFISSNVEAYWYFAGYQPQGRESLSPEDALETEIGLFQTFEKKANIGIRAYYYDVGDYIRTIWGCWLV